MIFLFHTLIFYIQNYLTTLLYKFSNTFFFNPPFWGAEAPPPMATCLVPLPPKPPGLSECDFSLCGFLKLRTHPHKPRAINEQNEEIGYKKWSHRWWPMNWPIFLESWNTAFVRINSIADVIFHNLLVTSIAFCVLNLWFQ